jgi:hypothetical protein
MQRLRAARNSEGNIALASPITERNFSVNKVSTFRHITHLSTASSIGIEKNYNKKAEPTSCPVSQKKYEHQYCINR